MSSDASSARPDAHRYADPALSGGRPGGVGADRPAALAQGVQHRLQVHRQARPRRGPDAGRLRQDLQSLDTFDRRANFQTWLVSVSRNLCIDHYRSVRKERETIDRDVDPGDLAPAAQTISPIAALEQSDRRVLLQRGLRELAPTLRQAVLMRDIQELSYQEIADRLRSARGHGEVADQPRPHRAGAADQPDSPGRRPRRGRAHDGRRPGSPPERSGRMNFTIDRSQDVAIVRLERNAADVSAARGLLRRRHRAARRRRPARCCSTSRRSPTWTARPSAA